VKTCSKCHQKKTLASFSKHKKGKGGLRSQCKTCEAEYAKAWAQTERGKASKRAANIRYNATEHGKRKRQEYSRSPRAAQARKRYSKTEAGQAYLKKYQKSDKRKAVLRRYYASPKGKESVLRAVHKRRALLGLTKCDLTVDQWQEICQKQNYKCAMCGEAKTLTRDHIVPLTKNGQHTASNIQALCQSCNSKKSNK
jgi:5-methylcytosine-specific restriction endonuclease McrA